MKSKDLAEILLKNPENKVGVSLRNVALIGEAYVYRDPEIFKITNIQGNGKVSINVLDVDHSGQVRFDEKDIALYADKIQKATRGSLVGMNSLCKFICTFCGEEDVCSSMPAPKICIKCATNMAEFLIKTSRF